MRPPAVDPARVASSPYDYTVHSTPDTGEWPRFPNCRERRLPDAHRDRERFAPCPSHRPGPPGACRWQPKAAGQCCTRRRHPRGPSRRYCDVWATVLQSVNSRFRGIACVHVRPTRWLKARRRTYSRHVAGVQNRSFLIGAAGRNTHPYHTGRHVTTRQELPHESNRQP